jgi:hypothetical protein
VNLRLICAAILALVACTIASAVNAQPACFKSFKHWQASPDIENFSYENMCGADVVIHYTLKGKVHDPASGQMVEKISTGTFYSSKCHSGTDQWFTGEYLRFEFEPKGDILLSCISKEDAKRREADPVQTKLEKARQKTAAAEIVERQDTQKVEQTQKAAQLKANERARSDADQAAREKVEQQKADEAQRQAEREADAQRQAKATQDAEAARQRDAQLAADRDRAAMRQANSWVCYADNVGECKSSCQSYSNFTEEYSRKSGCRAECEASRESQTGQVCHRIDPDQRQPYVQYLLSGDHPYLARDMQGQN